MPKITREEVRVPADVMPEARDEYITNYLKATRETGRLMPVSYTHLDVYKRQGSGGGGPGRHAAFPHAHGDAVASRGD